MDAMTVTTGEVRLSYAHLTKPHANTPGQEEKYSVTMLIPKSDVNTKQRIDAAIEAAKQKGAKDKWGGVIPPIVATPIHDGDGVKEADGMPFPPECKGHWVMTARASADYPPEIVDASYNPINSASEIYSGMYARVNFTMFPYEFSGKKGVGCSLGPVMKTRDGEALASSRITAAEAFGAPQAAPAPASTTGQQINPLTGQPM